MLSREIHFFRGKEKNLKPLCTKFYVNNPELDLCIDRQCTKARFVYRHAVYIYFPSKDYQKCLKPKDRVCSFSEVLCIRKKKLYSFWEKSEFLKRIFFSFGSLMFFLFKSKRYAF